MEMRKPMGPIRVGGVAPTSEPGTFAPPMMTDPTVRDLLHQFDLLHLSTLKAPASVRCKIRRYFPPLHDYTLDTLDVMTIQAWANSIRVQSASQARGCIKILRQLYVKARDWNLYHGVNTAQMVSAGRAEKRSSFVREHEMARLLDVLGPRPVMEQCYFWIMLTLFPRPGEADQMRVHDLSFWDDPKTGQRIGQWTKSTTKNGKPQVVPIPPRLTEILETHLASRHRRDSPWVFPGIGLQPRAAALWIYLWWEIRSQAGLDHITRHDLRRTGSSWATHTTGDLVSVSKGGLNHADLKTTSIYVQTMGSKVSEMYTAHEAALCGEEPEESLFERFKKMLLRAKAAGLTSSATLLASLDAELVGVFDLLAL